MPVEAELLERIRSLVSAGKFRIRTHAARHITEESFSEDNIVEAIIGKSRILEHYPDQSRCLVVGYFQISEQVRSPLHLVCEFRREEAVDIVTAYIPQRPRWITPWQRGKTT